MPTGTKVVIPSKLLEASADSLVNSVLMAAEQIGRLGAEDVVLRGAAPLIEQVFLHDNDAPRRALLDKARRDRRLAGVLLDRAFPDIARSLGVGWSEDRLSFVDVTIAASRLQDAVRALGTFELPTRDRGSVMLVLPQYEQHGLSASLAAQRMRAIGAPTQLMSGLAAAELVTMARRIQPSAIMISAGSHRAMQHLPCLISSLRKGISRAIPIVVGGPALSGSKVGSASGGADLTTNDLEHALSFCGFDLCRPIHSSTIADV